MWLENELKKAAGSNLLLHQYLSGVQGTAPEIVRSAVENDIFDDPRKLILKDTLEKNRKDIIYNIKREVNTGLLNGDRYSTVAKRIYRFLYCFQYTLRNVTSVKNGIFLYGILYN